MMLNMMNNMYPNMGYNPFNYNNNMYSNQALMNMMMNWMCMNPSLFQAYNNMIQNNNVNQINNNQNDNNFINSDNNQIQVNGGGINTSNITNSSFIPFPNIKEPRTNVIFNTQKGNKITIAAPNSMKIKDLLVQYVLRLGLGPAVIGDSLFFVYNGLRINQNEQKTVSEFFNLNFGQVVVLDTKDIIGAKINTLINSFSPTALLFSNIFP